MLMKENNGSSNTIHPAQGPFVYLWLANCVLYCFFFFALFVVKGWRKKRDLRAGKTKLAEKQKELYEA